MTKGRLIFDITFIFSLKDNLTGISRVVLSYIKEIAENYTEIEIIGIDFRTETYQLCDYSEIKNNSLGFLDEVRHERIEYTLQDNDILLLLGEQWLYPNTIKEIHKIREIYKIKVVNMVYDLVPFFSPEFYWEGFAEQYIKTYEQIVEVCDYYLSISKNTKKDLIKFFGNRIDNNQISVLRLGDNLDTKSLLKNDRIQEEYILSVSTIQPRKNHILLLKIWKKFISEYGFDNIPKLKIIGKKGWEIDEFFNFLSINSDLNAKVEIIHNVGENELKQLYYNALFTIYPSFYEGWGLPICESLSYGKLCLSSNTSSMPEAGGNSCEYFSPFDLEELYQLVVDYYCNREKLKEKEKYIQENYKEFTWSRATECFLLELDKVIKLKQF